MIMLAPTIESLRYVFQTDAREWSTIMVTSTIPIVWDVIVGFFMGENIKVYIYIRRFPNNLIFYYHSSPN